MAEMCIQTTALFLQCGLAQGSALPKGCQERAARTLELAFTQGWAHLVRPAVFYRIPCKGVLLQHPQRGSHRGCASVGVTEGLEEFTGQCPCEHLPSRRSIPLGGRGFKEKRCYTSYTS